MSASLSPTLIGQIGIAGQDVDVGGAPPTARYRFSRSGIRNSVETAWPQAMTTCAVSIPASAAPALDTYREYQPDGQKEHRRATDVRAGSLSP